MNTSHIKSYAPQARLDFINAVSKQAAKYGITAQTIVPVQEKGDVLLIGGNTVPSTIKPARAALVRLVETLGFEQTMDKMAYSWFNRLCAIRYMELHDYLDHGLRVLSHPDHESGFQLLDECLDVDLPGLDQQRVRELKLDGTQDEILYRELLLAQCRALNKAMPFLFEPLDAAAELLLPDNLTKTDSLIRGLVSRIPEENWQDIEIIGWLYQFYISDKKDEVIGKVVKSEDIPAATQLFTPNWIVKYMVQNSLGAQWLATYPQSPLKAQMEYYIEPAEQTDDVNAQLAAITPSQLNPEELTLVDPASGSGHILVEAYDLFKAIYLERGYRQRDLPKLILEKNLFGLDIDERAAQLTGFALMMKGRADNRGLFEQGVKLNVIVLVDSSVFDVQGLANGVKLSDYGLKQEDLTALKRLFEHATTFGSLIQVPAVLAKKLPELKRLSKATNQDLFVSKALENLGPQVQQAEFLAAQYDSVVANPPYMGSKFHVPALKRFLKGEYSGNEKDIFAAFIVRMLKLTKQDGYSGVMTSFVWMFISSYERLRRSIVSENTLSSLVQLHYDAFVDAKAHVCTFVLRKRHIEGQVGSFVRLADFPGVDNQAPRTLEAISNRECSWFFEASPDGFITIPGCPIAYWVSTNLQKVFEESDLLRTVASPRQGCATSDNDRFLRLWHEVQRDDLRLGIGSREEAMASGKKWFPYNKGGAFRRWSGNYAHVVNWLDDGAEIKDEVARKYPYLNGNVDYVVKNRDYYFLQSASWSKITSGAFALRFYNSGFVFDVSGCSIFSDSIDRLYLLLGSMNSPVMGGALGSLSPTVNFEVGQVGTFPIPRTLLNRTDFIPTIIKLISTSKADWDDYERSWDFQSLPVIRAPSNLSETLESSYKAWGSLNHDTVAEMKRLEEENNRIFIDAYGLQDELTPMVPIEQITLTVNPAYRYGGNLTKEEQLSRFRQDTMEELVSYAIGCMMGRYSLDAPGLIYANSGNEGFDPSQYTTFPADGDGIIALTDTQWFEHDVCNRVIEFISKAWDASHLEENLNFLADNLAPKKNESSRETIRRYLSTKFFKQHLKTYKKRPIYWLFSSGKQKAFECLVYLHRYNEATLSRMRTEYVSPLTVKMDTHVKKLESDKDASDSTAEIKRIEKEIIKLHKQQAELSSFDEKLRHYADQRISLDLDDGVKVNYGRFGDLLAEVKAVTGKKPEVI